MWMVGLRVVCVAVTLIGLALSHWGVDFAEDSGLFLPLIVRHSSTIPPSATATTVTTPMPTLTATPSRMPTPTATPLATTTPTSPTVAMRVVGYYPAWGIYERGYFVRTIDTSGAAAKLTHINYAFGNVVNNRCSVGVTQAGIGDAFADYQRMFSAAEAVDGMADQWDQALKGNYNQLKKLKAKYPHLKILISLGGWSWSGGFSSAAQPDQRVAFVESCLDTYIRGNLPVDAGSNSGGAGAALGVFDGIDIDWEYPAACGLQCGSPEDTTNFTALLAEFHRQLDEQGAADGKEYLLTIAAPAGAAQYEKIERVLIAPYLDGINLMTYDFHGAWSERTNFHAPLATASDDPAPNAEQLNVDAVVQSYLDAGVPAEKLVVGVPFYGRGWGGVGSTNNGLFQAYTTIPMGTWEAGSFDYADLVEHYIGQGYTRFWHASAQVPWLYNPTTQVMISYDDPESIAAKAAYIREHGLGGAMIWELSQDVSGEASLIAALHSHLHP